MHTLLFSAVHQHSRVAWAHEIHEDNLALSNQQIQDLAWVCFPASIPFDGKPMFRAPHFTMNDKNLLGGVKYTCSGKKLHVPGEVSYAHGGTLLLDNLTEFKYSTLVSLQEILKRGYASLDFPVIKLPAQPANVIATATYCSCGRFCPGKFQCNCTDEKREKHMQLVRRYASVLEISVFQCL